MPNVIISADSTCDLSPEQREHYQVRSFPFHIEFRGRDHLDNIDITPQVLFDGFYEDKSLPQTGACSPELSAALRRADSRRLSRPLQPGAALFPPPTKTQAQRRPTWRASTSSTAESLDHRPTGARGVPHARCGHERRRHRPRGLRAAQPIPCVVCTDTMGSLPPAVFTLVAYLGSKLSCRPGIWWTTRAAPMKVVALPRRSGKRCLSAT